MAQYIYSMRKVRKAVGDKVILDDVTLSFLPGAKIGVVGPNGAGKSTVLKMMAGMDTPSNGDATLSPGYSVGILLQEPPLDETRDVRGNVEQAVHETREVLREYEEINEKLGAPDADFDSLLAKQAELIDYIETHDAWELDSKLDQAMDALRLPPGDADVTVLSGGERRRVALCKLLLEQPDLLLLDEPTNHLDAESVAWLEQHLAKYPGAVLAVTHDRYFLDNVAGWILELDRGRAYPYEGNYSTYLEAKQSRLKVEGQKDAKRKRLLAQELEWVRSNPKARQAKSKARVSRYEELAAEADRARPRDLEEIQIPPGPRLGNVVIQAKGLYKGFDERRPHRGPVLRPAPRWHRRHHRPERRRQDDPVQDGHRRGGARLRRGDDRRDGQDRLRRPVPLRPRPEEERLGGHLGRARLHPGRQDRAAEPRLRLLVRLQGPGPAEAGRRALRWRAQPAEPRADPEVRRQRPAAGRADERPRRRHPAFARGRPARVPRAAPWSSATTAGSSTGRPRTSSRGRAPTKTRRSGTGSRATSPTTRRTRSSGWASTRPARTG